MKDVRRGILEAFGVTEADMVVLEADGYREAKAEADRERASFIGHLLRQRWAVIQEMPSWAAVEALVYDLLVALDAPDPEVTRLRGALEEIASYSDERASRNIARAALGLRLLP